MAKNKYLNILDSRGRPIKTSMLYATPSYYQGQYKPRAGTTLQDYDKEVNISSRDEMLRYSRQIFAQMGNVNNAITQKANWACGSEWRPVFNGKDKAWGETAIDWLQNQWYPIANVKGFDFRACLRMASINCDIDGDVLQILTYSNDGFPLVQYVEAHRIGCRNYSDTVVEKGRYKGLPITDGVIKNKNGRPVAYRILGNNKDEDVDISARSCKMIFDPQHFSMTRGLPKLASAILDSMDLCDIDDFLKQTVKIESRVSLIRQNRNGEAQIDDGNIIIDTQTVDEGAIPVEQSLPNLELMMGGEVLYIDNESDIRPMDAVRPSPNTISFIERIESRIMDAIGWPLYRLEKKSGAPVRADQEMFRSSILSRQETIEVAAKQAIVFAVATAMQNGMLPQTSGDWWNWTFTYPALFTVDQGNERAADINDYKLGIQTLDDVTTKFGKRWKDIRSQTEMECEDLLQRALKLSQTYGINIDAAVNLLSQRGPNFPPITETTTATL